MNLIGAIAGMIRFVFVAPILAFALIPIAAFLGGVIVKLVTLPFQLREEP